MAYQKSLINRGPVSIQGPKKIFAFVLTQVFVLVLSSCAPSVKVGEIYRELPERSMEPEIYYTCEPIGGVIAKTYNGRELHFGEYILIAELSTDSTDGALQRLKTKGQELGAQGLIVFTPSRGSPTFDPSPHGGISIIPGKLQAFAIEYEGKMDWE